MEHTIKPITVFALCS